MKIKNHALYIEKTFLEATFKGTSFPKSHSFCNLDKYEKYINQNEIIFNKNEPMLRQLQSCNNLLLFDEK